MKQENHDLAITITRTIKDIPESDWERLFGNDIAEGYGYHKTMEESKLKEFSFYYLLAFRNGLLVAVIPFFTNQFSLATTIQGKFKNLVLFLQRLIPQILKPKILFIGCPTCEQIYLGISREENPKSILDQALARLYEFSGKEKISAIIFYNFTAKQEAIIRHLSKNGFARMESFPNTVISVNAGSVEEYIHGLGKSTRKSMRRKLRDSGSIVELTTEVVEDITGMENRIYELYLNNLNDSDVSFEFLTPEFFKNICANMKGIVKFFITREKRAIVAFNLLLVKDRVIIDKFIGFDAKVSHKYHLYHTTLYHNIDYCIRNGLKYYQMGVTDYEPKIRLGAQLVPLYVSVKFLNPALNLFTAMLVKLLEPKRFDPALKKLKTSLRQPQ